MNKQIFFSPSTLCFYPEDLIVDYKKAGELPHDVHKVPYSLYEEYALSAAPAGNKRSSDKDGNPCWVPIIQSIESLKGMETVWVSHEMERIRAELEKVQDSDPKATGSVSDWRSYRKALRAWSESLDFPNKDKRPLSPDKV